jgi:outer membrane receptor protein involved in Fe transport
MRYGFEKPLLISIGVRNALNMTYIDHLSRLKTLDIPNPGFNIYGSLTYQFNYKTKKQKL